MNPARARLDATALDRIDPGAAQLPAHLRSATPTIVHLGLGAFARAHLAVYADDLLAAGHAAMIRAVSLRSSRAEEQLAPQDGLYTVLEREPGRPPSARVIGSIHSVSTGQADAVAAIAAPSTLLVTMTVTEKAYAAPADDVEAVARVVVDGIRRRPADASPLVVASLDNVADNGRILRDVVLATARLVDPALAERISATVAFPCSVVDRMVPATTDADLDEVADRLGFVDLGVVVGERHRSWVIDSEAGLPALADVGVEIVEDIEPYQRRKLWLLNGPHSALAYCGLVTGSRTIAEAATHTTVAPFVRGLVDDILAVADLPPQTRPDEFADEVLRRFTNPDLGHTCLQVGADGSEKLPQRILPVVARVEQAGRSVDRFAVVVAAWLAAVTGAEVGGQVLPTPDDPSADELRAVGSGDPALVEHALGAHASPLFRKRVAESLVALRRSGSQVLDAS